MSMHGTNDEEKTDLTKEESRYVRARSRELLGSLLLPIRARVIAAVFLVIISTVQETSCELPNRRWSQFGPALATTHLDV